MKWFLGLVVVLNLLAALYGSLKQHVPVDIHAQEISPAQLKTLPADWQPPEASGARVVLASAPVASAPVAASAPATGADAVAVRKIKASPAPAASAAASASKAAPAKPVASKPAAAVAPTARAAPAICYSWGGLDDKLLARVKGGLPALKLEPAQISSSAAESTRGSGRFWVHYPPLATRAETQTLSSELKGKGFDNYVVQNDSESKGGLSLGLFGREDGARALADRVKAAGFDKVQVDAKGQKAKSTTLTFSALQAGQVTALQALQKRLTPGIALRSSNCQ
ncbi:SPOR domain-containing protein [Paludibacterium yongneupense]|uniref:SPOR domain-containing protein n=1 Tax=Paludibacterium yongneupense TaxID=400061 RepID=UPI00040C1B4F|nr:SPOR domain-containing protein [Paludibacterium yongneupense]